MAGDSSDTTVYCVKMQTWSTARLPAALGECVACDGHRDEQWRERVGQQQFWLNRNDNLLPLSGITRVS